tara:strand:- start:23337 stop:25709 length:2373 start_codon:yes stop_codon:yes gene_type:complete
MLSNKWLLQIILLLFIFCIVAGSVWLPHFHLSIPNLDGLTYTVITLIGAFSALGLPLIDSQSKLKEKYGQHFSVVIDILFPGQFKLPVLIVLSFLSISLLIILRITEPFIDSTLYFQINTPTLLIITLCCGTWYCNLILAYFKLNNDEKFLALIEENISIRINKNIINNDDRINQALVGVRIKAEKNYVLTAPSVSENWGNFGIGALINRHLKLYSTNKSLTNLASILTFEIEHYIKLMPFYLKHLARQDYMRTQANFTHVIQQVMCLPDKAGESLAKQCIESFFQTALEMHERKTIPRHSIATQPLLVFRYSGHKTDSVDANLPSLDPIEAYYSTASQFYSLISKTDSTIIEALIRHINLSSYGSVHNNRSNDNKEINAIFQEADLFKIKTFLKEPENNAIGGPLHYYYLSLMLERLFRIILANMMHHQNFIGVLNILNIHSPINSSVHNCGLNFISYKPLTHAASPRLDEFSFAGNINLGQADTFFGQFIGMLILFNAIKYHKQPNNNQQLLSTIKNSILVISRLEIAKCFIKSDKWEDSIIQFVTEKDDIRNVKANALAYIEYQINSFEKSIGRLKCSGKLDQETYNRYKKEVKEVNQKYLNSLPLYKMINNAKSITTPRIFNDRIKRSALMKDTDSYHVFGGFSILQKLHDSTAYYYLSKFGVPISRILTDINTIQEGDVVFVAFEDKETLGNLLNQNIIRNIKLTNGKECGIYSINAPGSATYWLYKKDTPIFQKIIDNSKLITFPEILDIAKEEYPIIKSTYHIEPIDHSANESTSRVINMNIP